MNVHLPRRHGHNYHRVRRAIRRFFPDRNRGPKLDCGCLARLVEFLGEHRTSCRNHPSKCIEQIDVIDPVPQRIPMPMHEVDGVPMPWEWMGADEMSRRWCDLSIDGNGQFVGRRFDAAGHLATAFRAAGCWFWSIGDLTGPSLADDLPPEVTRGQAPSIRDVIHLVDKFEAEYTATA